jgi:hypothetical protein
VFRLINAEASRRLRVQFKRIVTPPRLPRLRVI